MLVICHVSSKVQAVYIIVMISERFYFVVQ